MAIAQDLVSAYRAALDAVSGESAVAQALRAQPMDGRSVALVAVGKAAAAMTRGALGELGERLSRGLVVQPEGYGDAPTPNPRLRVMTSAHPVPDARSLAAGEALVRFVAETPPGEPLLFLISGGTSSLVEVLRPGVTLEQLAGLNQRLLAEGHDIATINAARQALSRIKGGRLGYWLDGRTARVLLISDVKGNAPHVIGSGLLAPDPDPVALPAPLRRTLESVAGPPEPAPAPDDACLARVAFQVVADNDAARAAAMAYLKDRGYSVRAGATFLEGSVPQVARSLERWLAQDTAAGEVTVWGGEPTVELPPEPGRGGRMHMLAAWLADSLAGRPGWAVCAAGTDGMDGNSGHAGAVVDGETAARLPAGALADCLRRADTATCLERAGAVVDAEASGTNVMDLVIGRAVER